MSWCFKMDFTRKSEIECCYILGDFGVGVHGKHSFICEKDDVLVYGDITAQNLPFYAGNITYKSKVFAKRDIANASLEVAHFKSPVLKVKMDGADLGLIAFSPHRVNIGNLEKGEHIFEITMFGDRYNSFGTLHNCDDEFKWYGPWAYRTEGTQWTDSYMVREMGILDCPYIIENK